MGKHLAARMWPDHDFIESDFQTMEEMLDEPRPPRLSKEERKQKAFERLYARYLRRPGVAEMDAVTALRTFLSMYPDYLVSP